MQLSRVITIDRNDVCAKGHGQGHKDKKKCCPNLGVTGLYIQLELITWLWNDAKKFEILGCAKFHL